MNIIHEEFIMSVGLLKDTSSTIIKLFDHIGLKKEEGFYVSVFLCVIINQMLMGDTKNNRETSLQDIVDAAVKIQSVLMTDEEKAQVQNNAH